MWTGANCGGVTTFRVVGTSISANLVHEEYRHVLRFLQSMHDRRVSPKETKSPSKNRKAAANIESPQSRSKPHVLIAVLPRKGLCLGCHVSLGRVSCAEPFTLRHKLPNPNPKSLNLMP